MSAENSSENPSFGSIYDAMAHHSPEKFLKRDLSGTNFGSKEEALEEVGRTIGKLNTIRKILGLSQRLVGTRMGTKQSAVSELSRPGTDPRLKTVQRYARALGHSLLFELVPDDDFLAYLYSKANEQKRMFAGQTFTVNPEVRILEPDPQRDASVRAKIEYLKEHPMIPTTLIEVKMVSLAEMGISRQPQRKP